MSNPGQALLSIGGAVIGGVIGGLPGAQLGFSLGSLAGSVAFPTELPGVQGPRLDNLNIQTSTIGATVRQIYGTHAVGCEVLWSSGLIEEEHTEEVGGKGSGPSQKQTLYTYSIDVAVAICGTTEFNVAAIEGIRRIWMDALCVYDARPQQPDESDEDFAARLAATLQTQEIMVLYLGTEDQLPDPTIESYEDLDGTGIQAYREIAYVVFTGLQLEKYGNRLPNIRIEAYNGTATEEDCSGFSVGHLEPWQYMINGGVFDPRNPLNNHVYKSCIAGLQTPALSFQAAMAEINPATGEFGNTFNWILGEVPQEGDSIYTRGWAMTSTPNHSQPCDAGDPSAPSLGVDRVTVTMNMNALREFPNSCGDGVFCIRDTLYYCGDCGDASGFYYRNLDNTGLPPIEGNWDNRGDCFEVGTGADLQMWASFDQEMCVRRWHEPQTGCQNGQEIAGAPGFCIVNGVVTRGFTWTRVAGGGSYKALSQYQETGTFGEVTTYPIDPCLRSDDPNFNNQAFWEAAYADALAAGTLLNGTTPLPGDWVYGVDYPNSILSHATNAEGAVWESACSGPVVELECIPVQIIIRKILLQAGYEEWEFDVSDITSCIHGYCVDAPMPTRDQLLPLMTAGLIDAVESQGVLKFVERGAPIAKTLTIDDLSAHEHGTTRPTVMQVVRRLEDQLPRLLRLQYLSSERDYEPSEQPAFRENTTQATEERIVRVPIPMTDQEAADLANVLLYNIWMERTTFRAFTFRKHLDLEPTDVIGAPVDDEVRRMRITATAYVAKGVYILDMVEDDDGVYTPVAVGQAPSGSGTGNSPGGGLVCDSEAILLDLPALREQDKQDAGYWLAVRGFCSSWECAALYRSNDNGGTYTQVAHAGTQSTIGLITGLSLSGSGSFVELELQSGGALSSATAEAIAQGANLAAVGHDGGWCIIQFGDAQLGTDDTWTLSDITIGLFGTAPLADGVLVGDRFVLLDANVRRIAEHPTAIGLSKYFKVVTCNQAVDSVSPFLFTTQGLSYGGTVAPDTVISRSVTTPPTDAQDGDCYYIPINDSTIDGEWATHGGQIACWSDVLNGWVYSTPLPGQHIYIIDEDTYVSADGEGNVNLPAWHLGKQQWCGTLTPSNISSTQNDYEPTGLSASSALRLTATTAVDITGLAGGECGRMMLIHNIGANAITLSDEDAGSAAENRFALFDDVTLEQDMSVLLQYDETSLRWRVIGGAGGSSGPVDAEDVSYQPSSSAGLDSTNVQDAIDELAGLIGDGSGSMELVGFDEVTGSATNELLVSGLDLDAHGMYLIYAAIKNATGGGITASLYYNADTTATNYFRDAQSNGAATQANNAIIASILSSSESVIRGTIMRPVDRVHAEFTTCVGTNSTAIRAQQSAHVWSTLMTNVTQLRLQISSGGSEIAVGSKLFVYRITGSGGGGGGGGSGECACDASEVPYDSSLSVKDALDELYAGAGASADAYPAQLGHGGF